MIEKQLATVFYAPTARRRFFTERAAIRAEARALIKKKHPTEPEEYDDYGKLTYPGWHWSSLEYSDKLFRRVCKLVKNEISTV